MKSPLAASIACLLAGCAPDLDANGAVRCDQHSPCAEGASCYRGFCLPDDSEAGARELDSSVPTQTAVDAGRQLISSSSASEGLVGDAGEVADADDHSLDGARALDAHVLEGPESRPDAAPTSRGEQDARAPAPVLDPRSTSDAGSAALNPHCTLSACCEEARKASSSEKPDGRWSSRKGRCGCADPDVLSALNCGGSLTRTK